MNDPLHAALERAQRELLDSLASNVHTIYRGLKEIGGELTAVECLVCVVGRKCSPERLAALALPAVPRTFATPAGEVPTDVIEAPAPRIARLELDATSARVIEAANDFQRCHNAPIPGGVQIAPPGAPWVGTLGGAIAFPDGSGRTHFGALTNTHVAHGGRFPLGTRMLQPGAGAAWFGWLHAFQPIRFDGRPNTIDAALLACRRTDGPYAPATDTVQSRQLGLGRLNPEPVRQPRLGDRVVKAGRTTGITRGRLVGFDAVTTIDYGPEGRARFEKQYVVRADRGTFSAAGDSGSLILDEASLRPVALLFAGGGRDTLANPIAAVLDWCRGAFFNDRICPPSPPALRGERGRG